MLRYDAARRLARCLTPLVCFTTIWSAVATPVAQARADSLPQPRGITPTPPVRMKGVPTVKRQEPAPATSVRGRAAAEPSDTLLDEVGQLEKAVSPNRELEWTAELHRGRVSRRRAAKLYLWLGELALARHLQPEQAIERFRQARVGLRRADPLYGLAAYDAATVRYYQGAYAEAAQAFRRLLLPKTALRGYSRRTCALWLRHASACAGYHAERAKLGIPEPSSLDPLCGAAGIAVCLRSLQLDYTRGRVLSKVHYTGLGSSMQDLVNACPKLGLAGRVVTADPKGLIALPKPLIAYVEHDHFVALLKADKQGVTYVCSDCGPWPGGAVRLTWKQWKALEPTLYLAVARQQSRTARLLDALPMSPASCAGVRLASLNPPSHVPGLDLQQMSLLTALRGHAALSFLSLSGINCGGKGEAQHCPWWQCCKNDGGGAGDGGGGEGVHPEAGPANMHTAGPSGGDPVNLATGEEEYQPAPDLTVYNPIGPSITWSRIYNSLRGPSYPYESLDFGPGWSHPYNVYVTSSEPDIFVGPPPSFKLFFANGAATSISAPNWPSASQPTVVCSVGAGVPVHVEWNYNTTTGHSTYFTITFSDRTKWVTMGQAVASGHYYYPLQQLVDRNGNYIQFNTQIAYLGFRVLTSITDQNGRTLLSFSRTADTNSNILSVSDCYGRSVYYHCGTYPTVNVGSGFPQSYQQVDQVSQVVATGRVNPPVRWQYGYQDYPNLEGSEQVPFLHTISVPSPTGTGMATATINYDPNTDFVSSLVDANGNTRAYTAVDADHTKVTVTDPHGNAVYSYTAGFDGTMNPSSVTDGTNSTVLYANSYSDPNDPYRPSSTTNASGNITSYSWDAYGSLQSQTSPRSTVTTYSWSYANFALGELASVQEGSKTPTSFTYYEPSGLLHTMTWAQPGTTSGATTTYTYTYDALGNVLTETGPGNGTVSSSTTQYNYTTDGGYSQAAAINQPLTRTDNLSHVAHFRYDARGNRVSETDALGNETDSTFNLANQLTSVVFPATGQTGTGQASYVNVYLYTGGPTTQTNQYNESGVLASQVVMSLGLEGELLSRTGSTQPVGMAYDAAYRVTSLTDGNSHSTGYTYNGAGYLSQITFPGGDTLQYTSYDPSGNLLQRIDGRGVITNYVYNDPASKLTDVEYPATPGISVHLTYDSYGRCDSMTDGSGSTIFAYDDLNKKTAVTTTYTGLPAQTISYSYFPDGSRQSLTIPGGQAFSWVYDGAGRTVGLTNPSGQSWSWSYLDNDWLTSQTAGNVATSAIARNARGLLTDLTARVPSTQALLSEFTVGSDPYGNIGSVTSNIPAAPAFSGTTTCTYDSKLQLTQEQSTRAGGYTNAFAYDGAGNPTTFKGSASTFNADNQNTSYTFDGDGNPTTYRGQTVTYDAEDRLASFGTVLTAGYRGDGLRAWKQTSAGRTYFFYDGDKLLFETDATGAITAVNTWGPTALLARTSGGRTLVYTFDPFGNMAEQIDSSTGAIVAAYTFDTHGTRGYSSSDSGALTDPYSGFGGGFGYYTDWETGLQLLGHRYYDSGTGRFLNRDPAGYSGAINLYEFVSNSPLGQADPSGLFDWHCLLNPGKYVDCIGALVQFGISLGAHPDDWKGALCSALSNCASSGAMDCMLEGAFAEAGLWAGCLKGLVMGLVHTLLGTLCDRLTHWCEPFNWKCLLYKLIGNVVADGLTGCVSGLVGEGETEEEKEMIEQAAKWISQLLGAPLGAAGDLMSECGGGEKEGAGGRQVHVE